MGLPYKVFPVNITKGEQMAPAFLAISPNNKIPAIVDPDGPDGKRVSVFESPAPSCSISARRPANSCRSPWPTASRSMNG